MSGYRTRPLPHPEQIAKRLPSNGYPCVVCGEGMAKPAQYLHIINGGRSILHPSGEDRYTDTGGDMGRLPVGMDCVKKFELELWVK